ncbi:Plasmid recombination enzyme [uncultured Ruminococcus sp.]|nr:Plasmid recombination enzyme [uncultured Ruminococcus sp.]
MDEKTPHLHLTFVPLTKDNRLCAKEIIGNRANLTKWQDDFHAYMVEKYPGLGAWGERQQDRPEAYPYPAFQTGGQSLQTGKID